MTEAREMTKGEREELKRLARERARVAKNDAKSRTADLMADFEHQITREYDFSNDDTWNLIVEKAQEALVEANDGIQERCAELGIPEQYRPALTFHWRNHGPGFEVERRKADIRRVAKTRLEAMERSAIAEIDRATLEVQTQLVRAGMTSDSAIGFLDAMPSVTALMPALDIHQLELEPPDGDGL